MTSKGNASCADRRTARRAGESIDVLGYGERYRRPNARCEVGRRETYWPMEIIGHLSFDLSRFRARGAFYVGEMLISRARGGIDLLCAMLASS